MPPYPRIEFSLSIGAWDLVETAYLDTGFEGGLAIPAAAASQVDAASGWTPLRLADGSVDYVPIWSGAVVIEERSFRVDVVALGPQYLLGREVLDQMEVCFEFGRTLRLRFRDE